jgi:hypothetical protein
MPSKRVSSATRAGSISKCPAHGRIARDGRTRPELGPLRVAPRSVRISQGARFGTERGRNGSPGCRRPAREVGEVAHLLHRDRLARSQSVNAECPSARCKPDQE